MIQVQGSDGYSYYVRKGVDQVISLNTLMLLRKKLTQFIEYVDAKVQRTNHKYKDYVRRIKNKLPHLQISETAAQSNYTSYSVNKGEELHMCIKSKVSNSFHAINELIYVAIHEIAHIGCPEIGHTKLFFDINKFLLKEAMEFSIYQYKNYDAMNIEYCGINLNHTILNK
jgi:sensor c-di-GMP phosphodiesterase-like protein